MGNTPSPITSRISTRIYVQRHWQLYAMFVPVILFYLVFCYLPYGGLVVAFQNFKLGRGIWGSPWVGMSNFRRMFATSQFSNILRNTVFLNILNVIVYFPAPIILAIMLNEVRNQTYKRATQSLMYIPHFFSWVVLGGVVVSIFSPSEGFINQIIKAVTGGNGIYFMASKFWWPLVFVFSTIWKDVGWGSIIYLATISNINPELYEAAIVDGANRMRQTWHITLPGMRPTIIIMLILRMGGMMDVGLEQVMMLENAAVAEISTVISLYVYRIGIIGMQYSYTTAIGFFQSVVSAILLLSANTLAKRFGDAGIW